MIVLCSFRLLREEGQEEGVGQSIELVVPEERGDQLLLAVRIQRGRRFVQEEVGGLLDQSSCQSDSRTLSP